MSLTRFSIGGRLRLAFGALFVALMLVGGAGLYQSARINAIAGDVRTRVPSVRVMGRMVAAVERFHQLHAAALLATTTDQRAVVAQRRSEAVSQVQAALQEYQ